MLNKVSLNTICVLRLVVCLIVFLTRGFSFYWTVEELPRCLDKRGSSYVSEGGGGVLCTVI